MKIKREFETSMQEIAYINGCLDAVEAYINSCKFPEISVICNILGIEIKEEENETV